MSDISPLLNRTFRRHRYIDGAGWVVSQDTFAGRAEPKFNSSVQRTRDVEVLDTFLNTIVFRDNTNAIDTYVDTTYTFSSSGEAVSSAMQGTALAIGDRIVEDGTGYMLIVRGISPYRDKYLQHDEITCCEASQFDKKWVEPISLKFQKDLSGDDVGMYYDPVRRQYIKVKPEDDLRTVNAFGIIEPFDLARFDRDMKVLERSDVGKEYNDRRIINIDASFGANENTVFYMKGKYWKVEFMRESLTRVLEFGVTVWKQRGASGDEPIELANRNITL